jgi:DNA polymerase-3 subunit delta'
MSSATGLAEPDCAIGAPHPRCARQLIGQDAAQAEFLEVFNTGRLHHAWLLTGPTGVGKATLAWRIARFLLSQPTREDSGPGLFGEPPPAIAETLDTDPETPLSRRIEGLAEPRLFLLRRTETDTGGRLSDDIRVGDVRALGRFFALSAADGGRRVLIVDSIDELNVNAANALLKMLEEPPDNVVMLLISHQPARLLPTIRSRCRTLRLPQLSPQALAEVLRDIDIDVGTSADALAELSGGSAGTAIRLSEAGGLALYAELLRIADGGDRAAIVGLAERAGARGAANLQDVLYLLIDIFLSRLARHGAGQVPLADAAPNERAVLAKLAPTPEAGRTWAALQADLSKRISHGRAVNLDPAALILDTVIKISETAGQTLIRA